MPVATPSTWTWVGTTSTAWADSANWSLTSGSGNSNNYPAAGDTADDAGGAHVLTFAGTELNSNTLNLSSGAEIGFDNGSTLDGGSTLNGIDGTVAVSGLFNDLGNILVSSGDLLVVSIATGATLMSDGLGGLDIGINNGGPGEFNGGTLYVVGGTLDNQELHVNGGYADLTSALMNNDELSIDGGVLEIAQQSTVSPSGIVFVNANTAVSSTLKFDNPGSFNADSSGQISGFETGDTIDIGANTIGTLIYAAGSGFGSLTIENTSGSTIFSATLDSGDTGNFQSGTFMVGSSGGTAGSFQVTQGSGDTLISESGSTPPPPSGPIVTAGSNVSYTAGGSAATLDSGLTVTDSESSTLTGATIAITAGFLAGDTLTVGSPQSGIISNYDTTTGTLTLSGSASLAAYQTELDSVAYSSSATDPTSAGSDDGRTVGWIVNDGTTTGSADSSVSVASNSPPPPSAVPNDFNGDGTSDFLVTDTSGDIVSWMVQSGTLSGSPTYFATATDGWSYLATGDFYGNGSTDVLVTDTSGDLVDWKSQNGTLSGSPTYIGTATDGWHYVGTGDFTGNGTDDILVGDSSGDLAYWPITAGTLSGSPTYIGTATSGWSFLATADLHGTGTDDILLQNTAGSIVDWYMQNGALSGSPTYVGTATDGWSFLATGDFTGNGTDDLLLKDTSGDLAYWPISGGTLSGSPTYIGTLNSGWSFLSTGNYNGNSTSDIAVQNTTSGAVAVWNISDGALSGSPSYVASAIDGWHPIAGT